MKDPLDESQSMLEDLYSHVDFDHTVSTWFPGGSENRSINQ